MLSGLGLRGTKKGGASYGRLQLGSVWKGARIRSSRMLAARARVNNQSNKQESGESFIKCKIPNKFNSTSKARIQHPLDAGTKSEIVLHSDMLTAGMITPHIKSAKGHTFYKNCKMLSLYIQTYETHFWGIQVTVPPKNKQAKIHANAIPSIYPTLVPPFSLLTFMLLSTSPAPKQRTQQTHQPSSSH
jgi:hypothetical protein